MSSFVVMRFVNAARPLIVSLSIGGPDGGQLTHDTDPYSHGHKRGSPRRCFSPDAYGIAETEFIFLLTIGDAPKMGLFLVQHP